MTKWKTVKQPSSGQKKEKNTKKQHMGSKKGKLRLILPIVLVVAMAVGALVWALPHLPVKPQTQNSASFKGVVEMWNVETFEGGVGSRESWLVGRAAKFEKQNAGLYVHVTTLNVEQLRSKLEQGENFDMVCFSRGAGALLQSRLCAADVDVGAVKNNFALSGQVGGLQYAVPLYAGAYCLFARAEMLSADRLVQGALSQTYERKVGKTTVTLAPLVCGFTPYNSPLSALAMSGGQGKAQLQSELTQYEAYEQFLANRTAVTLLGTQRDMYRLSQREANGKIEALAFAPLGGYTDLVQYVGIGVTDAEKSAACNSFLQYLLQEETQSSLTELSLFSVLQQSFYTSDRYRESEALLPQAYVPNVFGDAEAIARQRQTAIDTLAV